ncbi:unnamed protein product, partial [Ectocarpus fasciculatus]
MTIVRSRLRQNLTVVTGSSTGVRVETGRWYSALVKTTWKAVYPSSQKKSTVKMLTKLDEWNTEEVERAELPRLSTFLLFHPSHLVKILAIAFFLSLDTRLTLSSLAVFS